MPQLIFKGIAKEAVKGISEKLVNELQEIIACPRDYFTLEVPETAYVLDGQEVSGNPLIQVNWFDRGQSVQDRTAAAIDKHVRQAGYNQIEIFFVRLAEPSYYENGRHY